MSAEAEIVEPVPVAIRVLGWILIVGGVASAVGIVASGGAFTPERSAINALSKGVAAAAGYGFLKLRPWAIYLYFGGFAATTVIFFAFPPSPEAYELYTLPASLALLVAVPAVVAALVARYWSRFA